MEYRLVRVAYLYARQLVPTYRAFRLLSKKPITYCVRLEDVVTRQSGYAFAISEVFHRNWARCDILLCFCRAVSCVCDDVIHLLWVHHILVGRRSIEGLTQETLCVCFRRVVIRVVGANQMTKECPVHSVHFVGFAGFVGLVCWACLLGSSLKYLYGT